MDHNFSKSRLHLYACRKAHKAVVNAPPGSFQLANNSPSRIFGDTRASDGEFQGAVDWSESLGRNIVLP